MTPAEMVTAILKRDYEEVPTKNMRCTQLGKLLGRHQKTVMMISNGGYCGKRTAAKITKIFENPRQRHDKPRLYTPFSTKEEVKAVEKNLSAKERREVLMAAAEKKGGRNARI